MFSGLSLLMISCGAADSDDEYSDRFSLLDGNSFVLEIDRIIEMPDAKLPMDDFQESDYIRISEGSQYHVSFTKFGHVVTIEPGAISGRKINDDGELKIYELYEDVFAGGRFVIWMCNDSLEAELTIYGSGVPVIQSERGYLLVE